MQHLSRIFFSALGGLVAAGALLWLMQWMILHDSDELRAQQERPVMEFIRLMHDTETRIRKRQLPEQTPEPQETPPPRPPLQQMDIARPVPVAPDVALAIPDIPLALDGPFIGPVQQGPPDRDFMAVSRMPPQYPYRAERRGVEGWVKVSFLITEQGDVTDVLLVNAEPEGVFDHAAIRAVMKWKFKPRMQGGKPVAARAEQVVNFTLNEE